MTLVTAGVEGALASDRNPLVAHGSWLQIYLKQEICEQLLLDLDELLHTHKELDSAPETQLVEGADTLMGDRARTLVCEEARTLVLSLPVQLEMGDIQLKITVLPTTHH